MLFLEKPTLAWFIGQAVAELWNTRQFGLVRVLLRRHLRRVLQWRQRLEPSEEAVHFFLAGLVGVLAGLGNLLYHLALELAQWSFLGRTGDPVELAEQMPPWTRVVVVAAGGVVAGLVLQFGRRLYRGGLSTNILEIVVAGDGRLPFRRGLVNTVASWISLGSGSSIGREGAVVHLAATLASKFGQLLRFEPYRLRLLVGCGAAGGMAAAFNAPISGAVFASTIVLGTFSMHAFAPLVLASVVAAVLTRSFFGLQPWYQVPGFDITRVGLLPWFVVLGVVTGVGGAVFLKLLERTEAILSRWRAPAFIKVGFGGLVVGLIAAQFPGVCGNGYSVTNRLLGIGPESDPLLIIAVGELVLAKLIATSLAVGSGTVGGVFTPTLFLGAGLGTLYGMTLHRWGYADAVPVSAFALVGMGGTLAATTHAPLFAMIMIFEISLNYSLMPGLMLGCVVAVWVSRRVHPVSVYLAPLRAKGIPIESGLPDLAAPARWTVGDVMRAPIPPVTETASLHQVAHRFLTSPHSYLPVVNTNHQLVGVVALEDLRAHLTEEHPLPVIAFDLMRPAPVITPGQNLIEILPVVLASEMRHLPVVNNAQERRLVGSLTRADVVAVAGELLPALGKAGQRTQSSGQG